MACFWSGAKERLSRFFVRPVSVQASLSSVKNEVFIRRCSDHASPAGKILRVLPVVIDRIKDQARSPEFWRGVIFGVATRVATKVSITQIFSAEEDFSATVVGVAACAAAGVVAGAVTFFVRAGYRNAKRPVGSEREQYWGKPLVGKCPYRSLVGLSVVGLSMAGRFFKAQAGSFAIGTTAGGVVGILRAGGAGLWRSRQNAVRMDWRQPSALQGRRLVRQAAFGRCFLRLVKCSRFYCGSGG